MYINHEKPLQRTVQELKAASGYSNTHTVQSKLKSLRCRRIPRQKEERMTHTNPDTLSRGSYSNSRRVADILRAESVGGTVLLIATVLAVVLANTPVSTFYFGLRDTVVGPVIPGFNHLQMRPFLGGCGTGQ